MKAQVTKTVGGLKQTFILETKSMREAFEFIYFVNMPIEEQRNLLYDPQPIPKVDRRTPSD